MSLGVKNWQKTRAELQHSLNGDQGGGLELKCISSPHGGDLALTRFLAAISLTALPLLYLVVLALGTSGEYIGRTSVLSALPRR